MTITRALLVVVLVFTLGWAPGAQAAPAERALGPETAALKARVQAAAKLVSARGEAAFSDLRAPGSRWQQGEAYIFVLAPDGQMVVHPDPALAGKNQLGLMDVDGRPIIRGLIAAATADPQGAGGWYHYQWPAPGGLLPRWKSSYVEQVTTPSGQRYVVGAGVYDDRMEREFVVDLVEDAAREVAQRGRAAFARFADPTGPFLVKDAYVFVMDSKGVELANPAFPSLVGRDLSDLKDAQGRYPIREMLRLARTKGSGWIEYMWPKPGESAATQKSAYIKRVTMGDDWVVVGSGVYLADAPRAAAGTPRPTATELQTLVREGAAVLERRGEAAYAEFRKRGSKWFRDDTYLFVWDMQGIRRFHAANPEGEGQDVSDLKDVRGRPIGPRFLEVAQSPSGEGWVHYMYPEPGNIFPAWKSTFIKRVALPSGEQRLVGSGVYDMQLDRVMVEDLVDRAAALVAARGRGAFTELRDPMGPFVFADTYVFVTAPDGTELVNAGQPSLEGKNLMEVRDVGGKQLVREYVDEAMAKGRAWVSYTWYRPGDNTPALKRTYVRRVQSGGETFIVGAGFYPEGPQVSGDGAKKR